MTAEKRIERRVLVRPLELRVAEAADAATGLPIIEGYAAVYNQVAMIGGYFAEKILPGAAGASISSASSLVIACYNHDEDAIPLARWKGGKGTLALSEDQEGLFISFPPPNSYFGEAVVESIRRGDTDGMSIGFYVMDDDFEGTHNGFPLRTISRIEIVDVCLTYIPAYDQTTVNLRKSVRKNEFSAEDYKLLLAERLKPSADQVKIEAESRARKLRLMLFPGN